MMLELRMDIMKNLLITILLFQTLLLANGVSVDAQIQKIRTASPQERVKLMNEFKLRVSQMNRDERSAVLKQMQSRVHTKKREGAGSTAKNMKGRVIHSREEIAKYQNMNQHQAGNQIAHRKEMDSRVINKLHLPKIKGR